MKSVVSPKYLMALVARIEAAIKEQFQSYDNIGFYIKKWHESNQEWNGYWENFSIEIGSHGKIDLIRTLHGIESDLLLKIAIDLGLETPDFIPSIPTFRNEIKSEYKSAAATFEKAFKQIETHPDIAIGLANSALESIVKEILKDVRLNSGIKGNETLYALTSEILRVFKIDSASEMPGEIKTIGRSLLAVNQSIEKLRSEKTLMHGKTDGDYIVEDSIYAHFVVNSVATVGLFLNSYYKNKFPKPNIAKVEDNSDDLPF